MHYFAHRKHRRYCDKESGVKVGVLIHPTRLATTGNPNGPSLYHLLEVLGKEKVMQRIERALVQIRI